MANIKFFYTNQWDSQTLEGSSEATNYPFENTQQRWKKKTWNATGDTSEYIRTTGSTGLTANAFFIFYHNITNGGTVTVKGSNDNWSSTPFSQAMTRTGDLFVYISPTLLTYDDFGFWVADAANPDTYIKLGRIWFGTYWEPAIGYSPETIEKLVDPSLVLTTTYGAKSILEKAKYKTWRMPFGCLDNTEYKTFIDAVGTSKAFVIQKKPINYANYAYPTPKLYSHYVSLANYDHSILAGDKLSVIMNIEEER